MNQMPIGRVIKDLAKKKRMPVTEIAQKLEMSRQNVYDVMSKRVSMDLEEIQRWADVLEVDSQVIIDKTTGNDKQESKSIVKSSFGEETLESIVKMMENELREKNEQIRALQKALEYSQKMNQELLGKSEGVSESADLGAIFFDNGKQIGLHPGVKYAYKPL